MVGDEHELAGRVRRVDRACGVREDERADAETAEDADAEDDALGADPLVQVRSAAHKRDRCLAQRPEHEHPCVAERGRDRPAGDLRVGDLDRIDDLVREPAQPAAEHDADARRDVARLTDARDRGVELAGIHAEPSATRLS